MTEQETWVKARERWGFGALVVTLTDGRCMVENVYSWPERERGIGNTWDEAYSKVAKESL